jgi:pimeloyl-ACP methyl ester carboxylesterase
MRTAVATHNTVVTQYIEADGVRFAYRRFGKPGGPPLVFTQHFRGSMDNFDPAITDPLAELNEIVLFDNRGVANTNGTARETVDDMAADAVTFVKALGLRDIALLGHSMGGEVAQMMVLQEPELVRSLILVGTGPRGGEGMPMQPSTAKLFGLTYERQDEMWLPIMFGSSESSQAAGRAWLERIRARTDRDADVSVETQLAHRKAANLWAVRNPDGFAYLKEIACPTLVVNGSDDIVIATVNSYILQQNIPNAKLVLYPDSNHGSQYEFHEDFVAEVRLFLSTNGPVA